MAEAGEVSGVNGQYPKLNDPHVVWGKFYKKRGINIWCKTCVSWMGWVEFVHELGPLRQIVGIFRILWPVSFLSRMRGGGKACDVSERRRSRLHTVAGGLALD